MRFIWVVMVLLGLWACNGSEHSAVQQPITSALSATPPLGWNSWNGFHCSIDEQLIRGTADALVDGGFRDAGYQYVVVDDCWFDPERAPDGSLRAAPDRFPSGMAALADYVHARGLKFGIYASATDKTCTQRFDAYPGATGSAGHERQDAQTFASWGVDYLKYDWCSEEGTLEEQVAAFTTMRDALRATGRDIVYSINPNSLHETTASRFDWTEIANLVRVEQDLIPQWQNNFSALEGTVPLPDPRLETFLYDFRGVIDVIDSNTPLATRAGPGGWNDPDMLVIGRQLAPFLLESLLLAAPGAPSPGALYDLLDMVEVSLTYEEARTHFSMWAMMAAPLIIGADLRDMTPADKDLLTNVDVIAVNQDPLGIQATPAHEAGDEQIWIKPLADGGLAVALFNRATTPRSMRADAGQMGLSNQQAYRVKNLWTGDEMHFDGAVSASVNGHGVALFRITPD